MATQIQYDAQVEHPRDHRVDALIDGTVVEVRFEPKESSRLRGAFMEMAQIAMSKDVRSVLLVIVEPVITDDRIRAEWESAKGVMRGEVRDRLAVVVIRQGQYSGFPDTPPQEMRPLIEEVIQNVAARTRFRHPRYLGTYHDILHILIHQWLRRTGPVQIQWLAAAAGCTYPTVATALERLKHCLHRTSDRRVELRYFPREEWARLVANSDDVRMTARFVDTSGQPRSAESLLRRLERLKREDLAIGGVWGAKHYFPDLDLVGHPRLDISLHCPRREVDWSFVQQLDPALTRAKSRDESPRLVVHLVHRAESLFEKDKSGNYWADPVECLLDLHESRLEPQAQEFLNSFRALTDKE
jgi:hypothetical protein